MVAVVVTMNTNRETGAESETDGGTWDKLDKTTSPTQETDFVYQGSNSISNKVGTSPDGVDFDSTTAIDASTGNGRTFIFKVIATNFGALNNQGANGVIIRIGSAAGDYYQYYVAGADTYPILGGWLIIPIDPNVTAHRNALTGTAPTLSALDYFGFSADFTGTAKSDNFAVDAIDDMDNVTGGITLTRGDSTSADGTFADFIDEDEGEGDATLGRAGIVSTKEDIIYTFSTLRIGDSGNATEFTDSGQVLVYPDGLFDAGFSKLELVLSNAGTVISISDCIFKGKGKVGYKMLFDTSTGQDMDGLDGITHTDHGYAVGDQVLYSKEGGSVDFGLTDATEYYISSNISTNVIQLATTKANALAGTNITLTPTGDEEHSFTLQPDTRPDLLVTGNSGAATLDGCSFDRFRNITLTSGATLTNCIIINAELITQDSGTITGCRFSGGDNIPGDSLIVSDAATADISNCTFTQTTKTNRGGHAVEYSGTPTASVTFTGNTFNGYGPDAATFTTDSGGVDAVGDDITTDNPHGFVDGDVVYYNKEGGTAAIGLTDGDRFYVNNISASNLSLHMSRANAIDDVNRVALNTNLAETHSLYSGDAAFYNSNTSGTLTLSIAGGATAPSVRNAPGATTTIPAAVVTLRVEGVTEGTAVKIIANETAGTISSGDVIMEQLADSNGVAEDAGFSYEAAFGAGLDVLVRIRNQGFPNAAILDDNGSFTDDTTAANSTTSDDMELLPATPVVNEDRFLFGHSEQFGQLKIDQSTAGTGGFGITWQYWNGAWTNLSGVTDGTSNFSTTGENIVSWTIPGDWATTTINSQGPFYYVRAAYTSGTVTIVPEARVVKLDVTRYLPFTQSREITASGLNVVATWVEDAISIF